MSTGLQYDVVIIGGGLAGLMNGILLSRNGFKVLLYEKQTWPFHKVCGEYISNEVRDLLSYLGIRPEKMGCSEIKKLRISSSGGKQFQFKLDNGGFGISRYKLDDALAQIAIADGTEIIHEKVRNVSFVNNEFETESQSGKKVKSKFVIGAYGKRALLDRNLNREFINEKTGFTGVKYHIHTDYPVDEIGLDIFKNGYCGIVKIEDDKYNLCYLVQRDRKLVSFEETESELLHVNPYLRNLLLNSKIIVGTKKIISEISFRKKSIIEDHIFMCGDTAGLIAPLCGNGMSVALRSAFMLSGILQKYLKRGSELTSVQRTDAEEEYLSNWNKEFSRRMSAGRILQRLSGNKYLSSTLLHAMNYFPVLEKKIIHATHGKNLEIPQDAFAVRPRL